MKSSRFQRGAKALPLQPVDDPGEVGRFAVGRRRAGTQAAHGAATAAQEFEDEGEGAAADDGDVRGRRQMGDGPDALDERGAACIGEQGRRRRLALGNDFGLNDHGGFHSLRATIVGIAA